MVAAVRLHGWREARKWLPATSVAGYDEATILELPGLGPPTNPQGAVLLMIENYRSLLIWRLMRGCPYLMTGLRRAGFTRGWLDDDSMRADDDDSGEAR